MNAMRSLRERVLSVLQDYPAGLLFDDLMAMALHDGPPEPFERLLSNLRRTGVVFFADRRWFVQDRPKQADKKFRRKLGPERAQKAEPPALMVVSREELEKAVADLDALANHVLALAHEVTLARKVLSRFVAEQS